VTSKIVSVTRIFNEEDIVEAFVRHNATHLDHMVFLDNGSSDATLDILRSLAAELPITINVWQTPAVTFDEISVNTYLYQLASQLYHAAWVVFLDTDEFLDIAGGGMLRDHLRGGGILTEHVRYVQTKLDNPAEPIAPLRQRHRTPPPTGIMKLIVRGNLGPAIVIEAGNHGAFIGERRLTLPPDPAVTLAHYPRRDGWQNAQKIIVGRLKVLATGAATEAAGASYHYTSPFETMRDKPHEIFGADTRYMREEVDPAQAEDVPLPYRGGPLRYTPAPDPAHRALSLILRFAEALARQHGGLLDQSAEARGLVEGWNGQRRLLF
jgi:hypothetical protein